ncbi:uncharacterized protein [Aegilops tauschii subsp. strangulata]|uniref:uncharacterized protein isoform X1 n=1 Tax=Aegilops tauschii subsp. strangulata TaxID=200361 RepID=UPI00098A2355|nr:GPI transamidase component PIG-T [Aegilops tauschii subsp. strangulata]
MSPSSPSWRLSALSLLLLLLLLTPASSAAAAEEFTEELLLRPLPDRKALAHFQFRSSKPPTAASGRHHHLFPKAISQLVFPWYVKVFYHSLQIFIDGSSKAVSEVLDMIHVTPSEDKLSPGTLEMLLRFPCGMQSATLMLDFDKGFLHIDEYPPDANQGFDIPSALVSFPDFNSSRRYPEMDPMFVSPLLENFKEDNVVKSYTEVLLVPLTTPDFSMPYNVITFACTVLALYFGSLLNALRRRIGEEECRLRKAAVKPALIPLLLARLRGHKVDPSESESSPASPVGLKLLVKVALVAAVAVVFHYLSNS